jgi:CubicO group peptidase (beta-lactamase class C family)
MLRGLLFETAAGRLRRLRSRLLCLLLPGLLVAAEAPGQDSSDRLVPEAIDSVVQRAVSAGEVAGLSVAVTRGDELLMSRSYGWADVERRIATPSGAVYEIGSITKQFTAAAILLLQDEGRLSIDDSLAAHLPDAPAVWRAITLRQLLGHTSGIPDFTLLPGFAELVRRGASLDSILGDVGRRPLLFAPGEAMAYTNTGYVLLGRVIEAVSGQPYAEYVARRLFYTAGMPDSSYCAPSDEPRRARGHRLRNAVLFPTEPLDHVWPYAAGSLCSTARDLLAWNRALHGGAILSAAAYRTLTEPAKLRDGTYLRYAAGLMLDSIAGRPVYRHGGSVPGFRAELLYFPGDALSVAVLANTDASLSPFALAERISTGLYGAARIHERPPSRPIADYIGEYRGVGREGAKTVFIGAATSETLVARWEDGRAILLLPLGGDRFAADRYRLTFSSEGEEIHSLRLDEIAENSLLTRVR